MIQQLKSLLPRRETGRHSWLVPSPGQLPGFCGLLGHKIGRQRKSLPMSPYLSNQQMKLYKEWAKKWQERKYFPSSFDCL